MCHASLITKVKAQNVCFIFREREREREIRKGGGGVKEQRFTCI